MLNAEELMDTRRKTSRQSLSYKLEHTAQFYHPTHALHSRPALLADAQKFALLVKKEEVDVQSNYLVFVERLRVHGPGVVNTQTM